MRDSMLGKVFALSDASEQAAFLNEVGRVLTAVCRNGTGLSTRDMQLCRIVDELDSHGKSLVRDLFGFVELEK